MYTEIVLDKPRRLRFDMSAFRSLEDAMGGQPLGAIIPQLKQLGVTATGLALWAGLRHEDRKLTQNEAAKLLDAHVEERGTILPIAHALIAAIDESALFRSAGESQTPPETEGNGQPEPNA